MTNEPADTTSTNVDPGRAKSIFLTAVAQYSPEQWVGYLDQACGNDAALRQRVEALLSAHQRADQLTNEAEVVIRAAVPAIAAAEVREGLGTRIGPYTLRNRLGEGGMGVVFLADQTEPVQRQVALKIIRPGMDTERVIARFEAERQALAVMDHPNVAKVLDAGTTASGRPYFVMELVHGPSITQYCDELRLSVHDRLELFIPVCQAVQHAHQKGIIHRDLKPSNILVAEFDGRPVPKVIDFGVAKAIDQRAAQKQLSTQFGQIVGTLEYMSPEQARLNQHDVDTRSDVYSLGAVLYELLTGITPFDRERLYSAAFEQALHMIDSEDPVKPSTRLSSSDSLPSIAALRESEPQRLTGLIRGELDWIVMKTLEKDRARRYDSASGLAQDINHYLHDQPVLAGPPSAAYRFRKFARRNKRVLATVGLLALVMVVGSIVSVYQAVRATSAERDALVARDRADSERDRAQANLRTAIEAVDEVYSELAEDHLSVEPMAEPMKRQFLEGAVRFYNKLSEINVADHDLRYERAEAYSRLGRCLRWLGRSSEAELAEKTAIREFEQLTAEVPAAPIYRVGLAKCCVELGDMLRTVPEGETLLQRALTLLEPMRETLANDRDYLFRLASAYRDLGWHQVCVGRCAEGETFIRKAIALCESLAAEMPDDRPMQFYLAQSYGGLAFALAAIGQDEDAASYYHKSIHMHERVVAVPPIDPSYRCNLSYVHGAFGRFLEKAGRTQEAEEQYRKSLSVSAALAEDFPHVLDYRNAWRGSYFQLGQMLVRGDRSVDATLAFRDIVQLAERLVAQWPTISSFRQQLGIVHIDFGFMLLGSGQMTDAAQHFQEAILLAESLLREDPHDNLNFELLARATNHLGLAHWTPDELVEAERMHRRAMSVAEDLVVRDPDGTTGRLELSFTHSYLAKVLQETARLQEAEEHYRTCLSLQEHLVAQEFDHHAQFLAVTYARFGDLLRLTNRDEEAEHHYRQAIVLYERLTAEFPGASTFQDQLAGTLAGMVRVAHHRDREGDRADIEKLLREILEISRRTLGPEHRGTLKVMDDTAMLCYSSDRHTLAHELYSEELEIRRRLLPTDPAVLGTEHPDAIRNMNNLAWFLATCPDTHFQNPQEAVALATKVVKLASDNAAYVNTLGVAQYRNGDYPSAVSTLQRSLTLRQNSPCDAFFLAMAECQRGNSQASKEHFQQARDWMDKSDPDNLELQLFRDEAAALLQVNETHRQPPHDQLPDKGG